ncbi:dihydrofolate reductase family protein [Actinomadura sp. HBU206391]|uniref:dihydrofolate reductase family protein n=1 Tax=Actinomadura sp. HBU206391 TaxID=2731692 RepID=UPI00164F333D|nr:dihydrofolate reductase family protein [Actinomadura sp. HBU206391]MBC6456996.1 dihydrofolate reductase family protein [Actinomadura sp. HBU206391]
MRKIVVGEFMSLDGVVESPEKWHFPYLDDEMGQRIMSQMLESDTLLLGRVTYQTFAGAFANAGAGDPVAAQLNAIRKVVVSSTLETAEWQNSIVLTGDAVTQVGKLKGQPGKDISVTGSTTLVRSLLRAGLVDELRLLVHPIVVGGGERLFEADGDQIPLKLVDSKTFGSGVLALTYAPA